MCCPQTGSMGEMGDFGAKDWGDGLFAFSDSATSPVARGDTAATNVSGDMEVGDFAKSSVGREDTVPRVPTASSATRGDTEICVPTTIGFPCPFRARKTVDKNTANKITAPVPKPLFHLFIFQPSID